MRELNRCLRTTHPAVLLGILALGLFVGLPFAAGVIVLVVSAVFQLAGGLVEASELDKAVPMLFDALDGEFGG